MFDETCPARKAQPDLAVSAGKVPTLWDGDVAVWDSLGILDYLTPKYMRHRLVRG